MINRFFFILLFFGVFLTRQVQAVSAATVKAHLFYGEGCPHCAKERDFLKKLAFKYSDLSVQEYEVYHHPQNNKLLQQAADKLQADAGGVPFLVIGDQFYIGFAEGFSSQKIESKVNDCLSNGCEDLVGKVLADQNSNLEKKDPAVKEPDQAVKNQDNEEKKVTLPLVGEVNVGQLSLPVLTVVLAFIDGFNPCAMWTLLFLISLLLGFKDRKRMWVLGTAFIVASSLVYFLFLAAWLNLFMFLGWVVWIRSLIGVISLLAAYHYLKDYFVNKTGGCQVMGNEKRQKVFEKIRQITQQQQFLVALSGIILLAVAVNLVELICSAGLPAIYTQILSLAGLATWQYYLYLAFYILIFMLDDLFVFFTAMITLQTVGIQSKYARYSHLIGGILMAIIGWLLLFKPEWLMFG